MPKPIPKPYRRGDSIMGADLNSILDLLMTLIIGGKGIVVRRAGNKIVIEQTGTPIIPV